MPPARPRPWATYAMIAANLAMFAVELARGANPLSPTPQQMIDLGASFGPLTLGGQWWRLVASMFLHYGVIHIAVNMICLYQGQIVEHLFGRVGFVVLYLVAGLGGGVASLVFASSHRVAAGASGAVFGVYGAFAAFLMIRRARINPGVWKQTTRSIAQFLVLNLAIGLLPTNISLSAHIGGLVTGFALGAALLVGREPIDQRPRRALALAAAGVAITAAVVVILGRGPLLPAAIVEFDLTKLEIQQRLSDQDGRAKAGELTAARFADFIERDTVPAYRQARQAVAAARPAGRYQRLGALLDGYLDARISELEFYVTLLRETDAHNARSALAAFRAHKDAADQRYDAYEAERARLELP